MCKQTLDITNDMQVDEETLFPREAMELRQTVKMAVSAGLVYTVALSEEGEVVAWGGLNAREHQIHDNTTTGSAAWRSLALEQCRLQQEDGMQLS